MQEIEIECKMLKWTWLTGKSWKRKKIKLRTSEKKVITFHSEFEGECKKKKEKKNQRRRKSTKTLLFLTESLKDWSKFLREKPDYSGNKTKTSLFVGGVNL